MTKKRFLSELKKRISILNEQEINDILNEYEESIDEKVKHGKKVSDAIADFGDIDELAEGILEAYKINPKYNAGIESNIEQIAKKLANKTKDFVEEVKERDSSITIETVFEWILKGLVFLVIITVLRLPFLLFRELGFGIFNTLFEPFDSVLSFTWRLIVWVAYMVGCVLIGYKLFSPNKTINKTRKQPIKKETKECTCDDDCGDNCNCDQVKEPKKSGSITNVLVFLFKIFLVCVLILPFMLTLLGLYIGLIVALYFLFKGLPAIGFVLALGGIITVGQTVFHALFNFIFTSKKTHYFPIIIGAVLFLIGSIVSLDTITRFDYIDTIPENKFAIAEKEYNNTLQNNLELNGSNLIIEEIVDPEMKLGEYKIIIKYYDELLDLNITEGKNRLFINYSDNAYNLTRETYNMFIDNLKDYKIYNYSKFYDLNVKVYGNQDTLNRIN